MLIKSKAIESYDNLNKATHNTSRANLALAVGIVIVIVMLAMKSETVVVVPSNFNEPITMEAGKIANKEYKIQWAISIATLLGNVNKKNYQFVIERITNLIPPELNPAKAEASILAVLEENELRGVRQEFTLTDAAYSTAVDYVWIFGEKKTTSIRSGATDSTPWTFEVRIGARNGNPKILDIQQYPELLIPSKREREIAMVMTQNPNMVLEGSEIIKYKEPQGAK
jgi:conjugal transfer pilus assembly protein TraE